MRADRLVALLLLLQTRGRMTAQELAVRLEVSERTIYRDLSALGIAGVPVYAERGPGGGCSLAHGYRTNLTGLTLDEARTLFMTGAPTLLKDLGMNKALDDALLKLLAALPSSQRQQAERARERIYVDPAGWSRPDDELPYLAAIQEAIWSDRRLRVDYTRPGGETVERVVDPLGLVAKASIWYLVAAVAGEPRVYRISRIRGATVLDEPATRPEAFDLAAYWATSSAEFQASWRRYEARVRVAPRLLPRLEDLYGSRHAALLKDAPPPDEEGWLTLRLTFDSLDAARGHILGFGADMEVLDPAELRESVIALAAEVSAFYAARTPTLSRPRLDARQS
jgi:predicted DNA-binding transcriptional regulator YafY